MISFVESWIMQTGPLAVLGFFIGGFIEEVFLPVPTPLLLLGAMFFNNEPVTIITFAKAVSLVILPISMGATLGSLLFFGAGYAGGRAAIDRFPKWMKISWQDVEKIRIKLSTRRSDELALFVLRCVPFGPTKIPNVAAGIVRMNPYIFTTLVFVGTMIRISLLFSGLLLFGSALLGF